MKKLFFVIMIALGSISAQSFIVRTPASSIENQKIFSSQDTVKILAVMVDFQEDKYDATTGTGKFGSHYTQNYADTIIDPLPHDAAYFGDHLLFAKNYFKKVSRGKLNINYKVLPGVITVSKTMRDYSLAYKSNDLTPLGNFAKEVWTLAANQNSGLRFSDYNLFVIFHAGVSSGLDLGTFSIDRNLPSLYIGPESFKQIFGQQFNGIQTKNGVVANSIILPETESRELTAVDNSVYLLQLSINGAIAANIGSFLGLPDLFNTETALSAIGRFGLMDGQAIIANSGMFPPEPSPWEKMFLGWESPVTINSLNDKKITVSNRITSTAGDTTLVKIPLGSSEYFLLENRSQDANNDKVAVTYKKGGSFYTKIIEADTTGLFEVTPEKIHGGVVVDVDEYDASVPGNGIVIWHIDDNIINSKISTNSINNDDSRRGVYVEEADGIFDIGKKFDSIFGTTIGEGSKEDFWFKENKSKLYKNRFSFDTQPNSKLNNGSNSLVTLSNFAPLSNKMSFTLSYGSDNVKPVSVTKINPVSVKKYLTSSLINGSGQILLTDDQKSTLYDISGSVKNVIPVFSSTLPATYGIYQIGSYDNTLKLRGATPIDYTFNTTICAPIVLDRQDINAKVYVATADGKVFVNSSLSDLTNGIVSFKDVIAKQNEPVKQISAGPDYASVITQNYFADSKGASIHLPDPSRKLIICSDPSGKPLNILLTEKNKFYVISDGNIRSAFSVNSQNDILDFSVADLFGDGQNYILLCNGKNIEAYNTNGNLAPNFPVKISGEDLLTGVPLAFQTGADRKTLLAAYSDNGTVYAFDPVSNKKVDGFPISAGNKFALKPVLMYEELPTMGPVPTYKLYLAGVDISSNLYVWNITSVQGKILWGSSYGNSSNNSFAQTPNAANQVKEFFPTDKAYNWPNPVYGSETRIRYYVNENSNVNIKIFDLAGDLVEEIKNSANGGMDNESVWNVSRVQSGIYYARIEVTGNSGATANKVIKIAVIK